MSNVLSARDVMNHPFRAADNTYPVPPVPVGTAFRTPFAVLDIICIVRSDQDGNVGAWYALYTSADTLIKQSIKLAEADEVFLDVKTCMSCKDARQVVYVLKQDKVIVRVGVDIHTGKLGVEEQRGIGLSDQQWSSTSILGLLPKPSSKANEQVDLLALGLSGEDGGCYFPQLNILKKIPWFSAVVGMILVPNNLSQELVLLVRKDHDALTITTTNFAFNLPKPTTCTLTLCSIDVGIFMNTEDFALYDFSVADISNVAIYIPCEQSQDSHVKSVRGMYKGFDISLAIPNINSPRTGRFFVRYSEWNGGLSTSTSLWTLSVADTTSLQRLDTNIRNIPSAGMQELMSLQANLANLAITPVNFITAPGRYLVCDSSLDITFGPTPSYAWVTLLKVTNSNTIESESVTAMHYFNPQIGVFFSYTAIPYSTTENELEVGGINFIATSMLLPDYAGDWRQGQNIRRVSIPINLTGDAGSVNLAFSETSITLDWLKFPVWLDTHTYQYDSKLGIITGLAYLQGADLSGNCFYIGTPTLIEVTEAKQIFAVYQTPPFEHSLTGGQPMLNVGTSDSKVTGMSATQHNNWSVSAEISVKYDFPIGSISGHYGRSYGEDFSKTSGSSQSTDLHISVGVSQNDAVHGLLQSSYVWEYPIFKGINGVKRYTGVLAIIIPIGDVKDAYFPTSIKDFAYDSDYEIGSLLTYFGASKTGYQNKSNLLYRIEDVPVTDDTSAGTSIHYSSQNSTHNDESFSKNVSFNAGGSLTLGVVTVTANYQNSTTNSTTTNVSITGSFSLSITTGAIKDSIYEYQLTPYIYQSADTGITHVKYDVELTGPGWAAYYAIPKITLMRVYPATSDTFLNAFSRSIRFVKNQTSSTQIDINVNLFNCSLVTAKNIVCQLYLMKPIVKFDSSHKSILSLDSTKILKENIVEAMAPVERLTVSFYAITVPDNSYISVRVYSDENPDDARIYWGIYPYDAFGKITESLVLI